MQKNENGQSTQTVTIESLAAELHKPIDEVRQTYEQQLARLTLGAQIQDFVAVFAVRNTRKTLQGQ